MYVGETVEPAFHTETLTVCKDCMSGPASVCIACLITLAVPPTPPASLRVLPSYL